MTAPMATTLFLARHGETVWHAENRYAGVSDVGLSERGYEQARRLGRWAAQAGIAAVWTSPLGRARATAAPAAEALGAEPAVDAGLRELDFGDAEGRTLAEFAARRPDAVAAFRADPAAHPLPGGEDPAAAADRGITALRRVAAAHPGGRALVVTHNTLLRLMLCALLGVPLGRYRAALPRVRNCALTELRLDGDGAALLGYNVPPGADPA